MNKIYIKFMSDEALETLKTNINKTTELMSENSNNSNWIKKIYSNDIFIEKKYKISDFVLKLSDNNDYKEVDFENSILLYESLNELPRHILTDERFWAWINFDKCYQQALQAMPVNREPSKVLNHYFFTQGLRRGLFFGVMSRCYFRVELSVDETLPDKYELTRFIIENPERFRNLSWRAFSNQKHIVLGVLKAEKKAFDEYGEKFPKKLYPEIAKYVSKIGSVRLIDAITEQEIFQMVYKKIINIIKSNEDNN